jgi:predicted RNA binding protein YcfA (HicA-like mRNA interferase family)
MLTNSRDIRRRLEQEGWTLIFRRSGSDVVISLPHPRKDLGTGLVRQIYKAAGWRLNER